MGTTRTGKRGRRITDEDGRIIITMRRDGHTLQEIAETVGRTRHGVAVYLARHGEHEIGSRKLPPEKVDRIIDWYNRGVPNKQITRHFAISEHTIYRYLTIRNVPRHFPRKHFVTQEKQ